ncbi:MAG TPA: class I SAM-dependent methyltransferase [Candidatus Methanomethylophilaceae archaeon]|nr:class I SAM-dependent methyltransferase [Candidatus Methanomethylophilaceae archaeon]
MSGEDGRKLWNKRSNRFAKIEIPSKEDKYVSLILNTYNGNLGDADVLDIGCGSGIWSLAYADEVKSVLGMDISDKMIGYANEKASSSKLNNVRYIIEDWGEQFVGIGDLTNKFDIVMAHMTPAINSDQDIIKMDSVCNGTCYYTIPFNGTNSLRKAIEDEFKVSLDRPNSSPVNSLEALFKLGRRPMMMYEDKKGERTESVEDQFDFYNDSLKEEGVSEKDFMDLLKDLSVDGMLNYEFCMNTVTIYWNV